ncbi:hypothetical protein A2U01_0030395, partial [Trifolium medium]|nr:hypothetical protein [Trifolium medium]
KWSSLVQDMLEERVPRCLYDGKDIRNWKRRGVVSVVGVGLGNSLRLSHSLTLSLRLNHILTVSLRQ